MECAQRSFVILALIGWAAGVGVADPALAGGTRLSTPELSLRAPVLHGTPPSPVLSGLSPLQETDFSGYWAHDVDASRIETVDTLAGLAGGGAPESLLISQARNGVLVISSRHNPSQPRVYRIGGDSMVPAPGEQGGAMTISTRRQEGTLVSEGSVATGDGTLRVHEILSLSDDVRTLVLEATLTTGADVLSNRLVYRRWPEDSVPRPSAAPPVSTYIPHGTLARSASEEGERQRPSSSATILARSRA